jgi:hypothetical protein
VDNLSEVYRFRETTKFFQDPILIESSKRQFPAWKLFFPTKGIVLDDFLFGLRYTIMLDVSLSFLGINLRPVGEM